MKKLMLYNSNACAAKAIKVLMATLLCTWSEAIALLVQAERKGKVELAKGQEHDVVATYGNYIELTEKNNVVLDLRIED